MTTTGGNCVLPFEYNGVPYDGCTTVDYGTTPWCATSIGSTRESNLYGTCTSTSCTNSNSPWSYSGQFGPEFWHETINSMCEGTRQAPINIDTTITRSKQFSSLT